MLKELSENELETYARQVVLSEIGYDGQLKLRNATACVIGLGGLGAFIAQMLAGMGVGCLRIVDRDIVSRSDLHRQYLYDVKSVGLPKVEVALRKLKGLNPDVDLDPVPESFNSSNADELIVGVDVVLDGLDRPEPRYLLNRTCNRHKIPYVFGGAVELSGNVSTIIPGRTPCLECFMAGLKEDDLPKCGVVGVHPSILGIITAVQVSEAIRILTEQEPKLAGRLLYIDLEAMRFISVNLVRGEKCPVCGASPDVRSQPLDEKFIEETCAKDGRRNFVISPKRRVHVDLEHLSRILSSKGFRVKAASMFGITFEECQDIHISMLKTGTMIAQTAPSVKNSVKDYLFMTYKSILVEGMGLPDEILPES